MDQSNGRRKKVLRSPGYPMIALDEAIEKIKMLWEKERSNPMAKEVATEHLGYEIYGGYSARVISALKQFGLISKDGNDIIVTQDGMDVSIYDSEDEHYIETVKKIALKPDIYNKLYNDFKGNIPSDANIRVRLIREYNFNPGKVEKFIQNFKQTIKFAGLENSELEEEEEMTQDVAIATDTYSHVGQGNIKITGKASTQKILTDTEKLDKSFVLRLKNENQVTITFHKFPLESSEIDRIKKYIDLQSDVWTEPIENISNSSEVVQGEKE